MEFLCSSRTEIRAVLFDAFGTLLDIQRPTKPYRQLLDFVRANNNRISKEEVARDVMCNPLSLSDVPRFYKVHVPQSVMTRVELDLMVEIRSIKLFNDVSQTLGLLRNRGYRLGVCSNLAAPYVQPASSLLEGMLDTALWSCEVGLMKPDPRIYQTAALRLGFEPAEVLMIGDSYSSDVEAPRISGFSALFLDRSGLSGDLATLDAVVNGGELDLHRLQ